MSSAERAWGAREPIWPVLKPVAPATEPRSIRVNRPTCVVGARSRVHLRLNSSRVSRSHALLLVDTSGVYVRDLASVNGLQVNGSPVREAELRAGNLLRVGPFVFQCQAGFPQEPIAEDLDEGGAQAYLALDRSGRGFALQGRTFLVGRRDACDLPLHAQVVSRVHAVIFRWNGRHFVRDLNSKNGTFVNGQKVREVELREGDEVRIADTVLRYESRQDQQPELVQELAQELEQTQSRLALFGGESTEAWRNSASHSSASQLLSTSGSIGAQTTGASTIDGTEQTSESVRPQAAAEDFEFSMAVNLGPPPAEMPAVPPEPATAAELFPSETSLPPIAPGAGENGRHTNGDHAADNGQHTDDLGHERF